MNKYLCINPSCKHSQEFYYADRDKRTCVLCKSKLEKINQTKSKQEIENEEISKHNDSHGDCPMGIGRDFCRNCQHSEFSLEDYEHRCNYKK